MSVSEIFVELQGFLAAEQDIREARPLSPHPLSLSLLSWAATPGPPPSLRFEWWGSLRGWVAPRLVSAQGTSLPRPPILLPGPGPLCSGLGSLASPTSFGCQFSSFLAYVYVEASVSAWDSDDTCLLCLFIGVLKARVPFSLKLSYGFSFHVE